MKLGFRMSSHHFITLHEFFWLAQNDAKDFRECFRNPTVYLHALEHTDIGALEEYPEFVQRLLNYNTTIQDRPYPIPEDYMFSLEKKLTNITI